MSVAYSGRRRRRSKRNAPVNEINVTPFVDVMLVLLVIFIASYKFLTVTGVPVDLPKTQAKSISLESQPISISVQKDGSIFLQETPITLEELVPKLGNIAKAGYKERLYVRGDTVTNFGNVMKVMGALNRAGYKKIGLVSLEEQSQ